jgi:pyruvate ferredoxin oxidoreductase alpha subunit
MRHLTGPDGAGFRWDTSSMRIRPGHRETEQDFPGVSGRTTRRIRADDADVVVIAMGTLGKEAEVAVDLLRREGIRAGSLRIRWFRPFPDLDLSGR